MTSKEALEIFYKDVKNYNNDMRRYPAYYFDKPKNEEMLRKWEIKQNEMYATILNDLEVLEILKERIEIKGDTLIMKCYAPQEQLAKVKEWLERK